MSRDAENLYLSCTCYLMFKDEIWINIKIGSASNRTLYFNEILMLCGDPKPKILEPKSINFTLLKYGVPL